MIADRSGILTSRTQIETRPAALPPASDKVFWRRVCVCGGFDSRTPSMACWITPKPRGLAENFRTQRESAGIIPTAAARRRRNSDALQRTVTVLAVLGCCGATAASAVTCRTDFECSFNGVCNAGSCVCSPAWTGAYCHELNLLPAANDTGLNQLHSEPPISNWGAAVLLGEDGLYHMWASEIVNSCGVHAWNSNSQIVHATSPTATGQYTRKEVVFGVFSHEPQVVRAPTGEYIMYFTHYPNGSATEYGVCNCSGSGGNSHPHPHLPQCGGPLVNVSDPGPLSTYFSYASGPGGPWSAPELLISTAGRFDTNLSPYIFPNGSVLAWTRGQIWTASHWKNASSWKRTGADWKRLSRFATPFCTENLGEYLPRQPLGANVGTAEIQGRTCTCRQPHGQQHDLWRRRGPTPVA